MGGLQSLLTPGATFDLASKGNWTAVLGAALSAGSDNNLAAEIANLNVKDAAGWTRLIQHAGKNQPQLLAALANVNSAQAGKEQWIAFVQAAGKGDTRAVQRLMGDSQLAGLLGDAGTGLTAALNALPGKDGGVAIAQLLLDRGADPSTTDKKGESALKRARGTGLNIVADLLQKAADAK
jgi:ankyrin repeat protein